MISYEDFVRAKVADTSMHGFRIDPEALNPLCKPHQRVVIQTGVLLGRYLYALAAGLGKTIIQVETVRQVLLQIAAMDTPPSEAQPGANGRGLIVIELAVLQEFQRDAAALGVPVRFVRSSDEVYMRRYRLFKAPFGLGRLYLHHFRRSDLDRALHDHPWPFVTLILQGGYLEHTEEAGERCWFKVTRWWGPGSVLFRKATHRHYVELRDDVPAVTLCFVGPRRREWGFILPAGWLPWRDAFKMWGCPVKDETSSTGSRQ